MAHVEPILRSRAFSLWNVDYAYPGRNRGSDFHAAYNVRVGREKKRHDHRRTHSVHLSHIDIHYRHNGVSRAHIDCTALIFCTHLDKLNNFHCRFALVLKESYRIG